MSDDRSRFVRLIAPILLAVCGAAQGADWPQYRGPDSNGTTSQKIATQWPADGLKAQWQVPLGSSLGSFIVADKKLFVFEMHGENESLVGLNPTNGQAIWERDIENSIRDNSGGDGPRSTPTYSDGRVYVLGTYLELACVNATDGQSIWSHNLKREFGGKEPGWGNAASPLVDGDLVFACAGGKGQSLIAFNKTTGAVAWKGEDDKPTHASPIPATIAGVHQIIFFTQKGLVAVKPETGHVLWRQPFKFAVSTAASPVVCGEDIIYCSAGYGVGGGAYKIAKSGDSFTSTELWRKEGGDVNHWSTPVYKDGCLYGLYGFKEFHTEPLKCIDVKTGDEKWSKSGFGQGEVILVDGNLLIQGDQGELVLAKAQSDGYQELARCHPITGKCWTDPVVADGRIFVRSQTGGACLDTTGK